jgi:hypothetical protein
MLTFRHGGLGLFSLWRQPSGKPAGLAVPSRQPAWLGTLDQHVTPLLAWLVVQATAGAAAAGIRTTAALASVPRMAGAFHASGC